MICLLSVVNWQLELVEMEEGSSRGQELLTIHIQICTEDHILQLLTSTGDLAQSISSAILLLP